MSVSMYYVSSPARLDDRPLVRILNATNNTATGRDAAGTDEASSRGPRRLGRPSCQMTTTFASPARIRLSSFGGSAHEYHFAQLILAVTVAS